MIDESKNQATVTAPTMGGLDAMDEQLIEQLADRARSEGLQLTGAGGLLARLTKRVVESAFEGEMDDHLGYGKHDQRRKEQENKIRNLPRRHCHNVGK